jgi:hypothetical protein
MGYRPPKGVRPPQLEGKRKGRPKGSTNRPQVHLAMLHVSRRGPEEDKTELQQMARKWMHENPMEFFERLDRWENPDLPGDEPDDELDDE